MEKVMLSLANNASEFRKIKPKNSVSIHALELKG